MILVKPSFEIISVTPNALQLIEQAGRTCYKSEEKITNSSASNFVKLIIKSGHESVIEHAVATVRIICDRGVTHEIVRHRLANYSQESTRYCNYKGGVTFVIPPWLDIEPGEYVNQRNCDSFSGLRWMMAMLQAEDNYIELLELGWSPQQARSVLTNSLKTEIVMTANFREWRHFFKLRTAKAAHPQMKEIAIPMLEEFQRRFPVVFGEFGSRDKE